MIKIINFFAENSTIIFVLAAAFARFKVLKKQQHLPWQCYWLGHDWDVWSLYPQTSITIKDHEFIINERQYRNCYRCKKHEQVLVAKTNK
jgi:hypothetical protein